MNEYCIKTYSLNQYNLIEQSLNLIELQVYELLQCNNHYLPNCGYSVKLYKFMFLKNMFVYSFANIQNIRILNFFICFIPIINYY